jgi:hypothetical protein
MAGLARRNIGPAVEPSSSVGRPGGLCSPTIGIGRLRLWKPSDHEPTDACLSWSARTGEDGPVVFPLGSLWEAWVDLICATPHAAYCELGAGPLRASAAGATAGVIRREVEAGSKRAGARPGFDPAVCVRVPSLPYKGWRRMRAFEGGIEPYDPAPIRCRVFVHKRQPQSVSIRRACIGAKPIDHAIERF